MKDFRALNKLLKAYDDNNNNTVTRGKAPYMQITIHEAIETAPPQLIIQIC